MDNSDIKIISLETPLLLTNPIDSNLQKNIQILRIRDLIKIRYLETKNLNIIKQNTIVIDEYIKKKTTSINEIIQHEETELKRLYNEKKLLNQNVIQSDIIKNQKKLIYDYKQNNIDLKLGLDETEKRLKENELSNKKFLINNAELKNTISRYIAHNRKLQDNIIQLNKTDEESPMTKQEIDEMTDKINFYQEENMRLSSEIALIKTDLVSMKINFIEADNQKNKIYKQIKELNNSLIKDNIIATPFSKEKVKEDLVNLEVLNDTANTKLDDLKKKQPTNDDLNEKVNDIFIN